MAVGYSLGALVDRLFDIVYPVGICIDFDSDSADPNVLFPGTVWVRITDSASFRASNGVGNAGTTNGDDNLTLTTDHLPTHSHAFSKANIGSTNLGSKTSSSFDYATKTVSTFDHGSKTTSSFDYGTKSTNTTGAHTHGGVPARIRNRLGGDAYTMSFHLQEFGATDSAGGHAHSVAIGAHTHTVEIGSHNHTVDIGAHSHTVVIGSHNHTLDIAIDNSGGGQSFSALNKVHYYARWRRRA